MPIKFDAAISISSLYLALVGLLTTIFSVQLSQWLSGIQANASKWQQIKNREPRMDFFPSRLECYYNAAAAASLSTLAGWTVVTLFLATVLVFAEILRAGFASAERAALLTFVQLPCYVFFAIYLISSIIMLLAGYRRARAIRNAAQASL